MNYRCKVNYKSVLIAALAAILLYGITLQGHAAFQNHSSFFGALTFLQTDTVPSPAKKKPVERKPLIQPDRDSAAAKNMLNDTIPVQKDSVSTDSLQINDSTVQKIDTFNLKISKDSIDAPVDFEAEDSMVIDIPGQKIYLYNKASVKFKDVSLDAAIIELNQPTQILTAYSVRDSANLPVGVPAFKQGESAFTSDTIRYNFKTQRGLTIGTYTQEGEMYIYGEKVKRISPTVFFAEKARFTSCNYDTPHFAFKANKVKFISNNMAVTGLIRPEFEGISIPVGLPFGLFNTFSGGQYSIGFWTGGIGLL